MPTIEVLDPADTAQLMGTPRFGSSETLRTIATHLMSVLDTDQSVFVEGLKESQIAALRTRMTRANVRLNIHKVARGPKTGHLIIATTIR